MKALVPLADGSEEIEATTIANILVRAGVTVELASVMPHKTIKGSRGIQIVCDKHISECTSTVYDLIALPGGLPGAETLKNCSDLIKMLQEQKAAGRFYAAICASPAVVLEPHGLLDDRKATCYPCFKLKAEHAANSDAAVVVCENLVTSKGPATSMAFALKLVEVLKGREEADKISQGLLCS